MLHLPQELDVFYRQPTCFHPLYRIWGSVEIRTLCELIGHYDFAHNVQPSFSHRLTIELQQELVPFDEGLSIRTCTRTLSKHSNNTTLASCSASDRKHCGKPRKHCCNSCTGHLPHTRTMQNLLHNNQHSNPTSSVVQSASCGILGRHRSEPNLNLVTHRFALAAYPTHMHAEHHLTVHRTAWVHSTLSFPRICFT